MDRRWLITLATMLLIVSDVSATGQWTMLGPRDDTVVVAGPGDEDICPGTVELRADDGTWENAVNWVGVGVIAPDYGSMAECYDSEYTCGVRLVLTQLGDYNGHTMDVYVWDSVLDGEPPPGPDPGNVLCRIPGFDPGAPALWPELSIHDIQVCCETGGVHFVGYWPNWPGEDPGWFVASDDDGPAGDCTRTKVAPGIGYPTGWQDPCCIFPIEGPVNLGIRELAGSGDCPPTPISSTTWGQIKALY